VEADSLTKAQTTLVGELDELCSLFSLDYWNIGDYERDSRTPYLRVAKDKVIRGQIVIWYTLIDEFLNLELVRYFFGRKRNTISLWRTKKFKNFNYYFLEPLSLLEKLRFVRAIKAIPKKVSKDIEALNFLRNGLAHAFFPENLRQSKPVWKGKSVFTLEGARQLSSDIYEMVDFFVG
jgi:hypothetical protein